MTRRPTGYRKAGELAAQYLLLYELSLPQGLDLNNQIDTARTATRMTVSSTTLLIPRSAGNQRACRSVDC